MTIRQRIEQLRQLCGEDPTAALAVRIDALPIYRDEHGWVAVREDGSFLFVDNDSGRIRDEVPPSLVWKALTAAAARYPELHALLSAHS